VGKKKLQRKRSTAVLTTTKRFLEISNSTAHKLKQLTTLPAEFGILGKNMGEDRKRIVFPRRGKEREVHSLHFLRGRRIEARRRSAFSFGTPILGEGEESKNTAVVAIPSAEMKRERLDD